MSLLYVGLSCTAGAVAFATLMDTKQRSELLLAGKIMSLLAALFTLSSVFWLSALNHGDVVTLLLLDRPGWFEQKGMVFAYASATFAALSFLVSILRRE